MLSPGTIVAISSATGTGSRMIVRLSGPAALSLAHELTGDDIPHAAAVRRTVRFNRLAVPAWIYAFRGPRSSTGEDVVELHIPGNPLLARLLMSHLLACGARSAEPGEFTARAYFNGKMDLSAAEGVAAAIAARSEAQLQAARQLLAGELANRVRPILDGLAETLALLEVGIDFVDEDVTFLSNAEVEQRIRASIEQIKSLGRDAVQIEPLSHEPTVVLVGRPNVGKSTLLNALASRERAVVSNVAGTTRDIVSQEVALPSGTVRVWDVAGVEHVATTGSHAMASIERQMQERTRTAIESADVVVLVDDVLVTGDIKRLELPRSPHLTIYTKIDLPNRLAVGNFESVHVSAKTGQGLSELRDRLNYLCFGETERRGLAINARHLQHMTDAVESLMRGLKANANDVGTEIVAMELRHALDDLGAIVGSVSPDELLGRVFSRFCIGK